MEVTLIWSWASFWIGALTAVAVAFVGLMTMALVQYNKKKRRY
mgnify:FL=1